MALGRAGGADRRADVESVAAAALIASNSVTASPTREASTTTALVATMKNTRLTSVEAQMSRTVSSSTTAPLGRTGRMALGAAAARAAVA